MPRVPRIHSSPVWPSAQSCPVSLSTTAISYPGATWPIDRVGSCSLGLPVMAWDTSSVMP